MQPTIASLCDLLVRTDLFPAAEVQTLQQRWRTEVPAGGDAQAFARWLVTNHYLTEYQAGRLLKGQADHYYFDKYKLLERIGVGGMAGVFKAIHRDLGQIVAIKVLPPSKAKNATALGRFQRESRLALGFKHPNVVRTLKAGESHGLHYFVMAYLDGVTLEDVLARRGKLAPADAVLVIGQALTGLQHLHEAGVVHRDLKPANLMLVPAPPADAAHLSPDTNVILLDVGVGRSLSEDGAADAELTKEGSILGSPDYMAPEQAADAHKADIRADIYGLGCVLYHALAGQPPFPGPNPVQKIIRHAGETPRPLKEFQKALPEPLQQVVNKMVAKDPAQRYPTPAAAAQALASSLTGAAPKSAVRLAPAAATAPTLDYPAKTTPVREGPPPVPHEVKAAGGELPTEINVELVVPRRAPPAARGFAKYLLWKVLASVGVALAGLALVLGIRHFNQDTAPEAGPGPVVKGEPSGPDPAKAKTLEEWKKIVAQLPPPRQVAAVAARLKQANPAFDGKLTHEVKDNAVTSLQLVTDSVTDLTPISALPRLKKLVCAGSDAGKGKLVSLAPLKGMGLAVLEVGSNPVGDLTPLKGMPLLFLGIAGTQVRDLSPVEECPLMVLNCAGTPVHDLAPVRRLELTLLDVADTAVMDLVPLKGMSLEALWGPVQPLRDADLVRAIPKLKEINGQPVAAFFKDVEARRQELTAWAAKAAKLEAEKQVQLVKDKLKELNPNFDGTLKFKIENGAVVELSLVVDQVTDLSPLKVLTKLRRLSCHGSAPGQGQLSNLQPLRGLPLVELDCGSALITDLTPLAGMPLTYLNLDGNAGITSLVPLQKSPLTRLHLSGTQVRDLSPLRGMALTSLACPGAPVVDLEPLRDMPLTGLSCDFHAPRDLGVLRSLKALAKLNHRPWKEIDARERAFEAWMQSVAAMPAAKQVQAVTDALRERNPGFTTPLAPKIDKNVVTELTFKIDQVTDLTPLRALRGLRKLTLTKFAASSVALADLWPLYGLPLRELVLPGTAVADLAPLRGMKLEILNVASAPVSDLSALAESSLRSLDVSKTRVLDFSPLQKTQIKSLRGEVVPDRDRSALEPIKTLVTINGRPAAEMWMSKSELAEAKKKPATVAVFRGKLVEVNNSQQRLTLRLTQNILVQNPYHAWHLAWHQQRMLLDAARARTPADRIRSLQDHSYWIAYHQSLLYRRHTENQNLDLQAAAQVKVRVTKLPPAYDDKGNIRKHTKEELAELKGTDPKMPGYISDFTALGRDLIVEVHLIRIDAAARDALAKGLEAESPLQVIMIVVL